MFKAIAIINGEQATLTAPSVNAMFMLIHSLDFDIFVNGVQVKAKNGQLAGCNGYFAGVTKSYLEKLYK